ncbi:MAG: ribosome recycling factor [Candidatus Paceibacterota bacterium]
MVYNFSKFNDEAKRIQDWLQKEFSGIRTSRATPAILDGISVESYGTKMPIKQVANIISEDAKTLRIAPWDASMGKEIEKAIVASNLGLSVASDDKGVRVSFPELTADRRTALIKLAKEKTEEAKISIRKIRDVVMKDIQSKEKEAGMGEDEVKRLKNEAQKLVDTANKKLQEMEERKNKEIQS